MSEQNLISSVEGLGAATIAAIEEVKAAAVQAITNVQREKQLVERQRDELLALIKNDAFAMSFQSMGQCRTALIASVKGGAA